MQSQRTVIIAEAQLRAEAKQVAAAIGCNIVGEANNPEDGLRLVRRVQPDLILLEVGDRGMTLLHILCTQEVAPVVVVLSAQQQAILERVVETGAAGVVFKPFGALDLATVLTVAVHSFHKADLLRQKLNRLEEEVQARKLIDRAKGKVMLILGISEADAYRWMQKTSMDTQRSLKKVASDILKDKLHLSLD